jgi:hypothetical protein
VSAGRKSRGGVSFTVHEGGRDQRRQPMVPREDPRDRDRALLLAGAIIGPWVLILAGGYAFARAMGWRP